MTTPAQKANQAGLGFLAVVAAALKAAQEKHDARPAGKAQRKGRAGAIRARKRRRIRARDRVLQRNTWRSFGEHEKREARS